jgi:hypothetical protein
MKQDRITVIILLIGEASGVFAGFCPSWFTVSSPFFHEQDAKSGNVKRIRWGEAAATGIVLATGAAVSRSMNDPIPFFASAAISGIFVGGYEYMIAHPATEENDTSPEVQKGLPSTPHVATDAEWGAGAGIMANLTGAML